MKKVKVRRKINVKGVEVEADIWEYGFNDDDIKSYNEEIEMENDIIVFKAYKKKMEELDKERNK